MPDKGVAWLDGRGGNPTRHSSVYACIKKVEKLETKGLGVKPNDKRAYNQPEYNKVFEIMRSVDDFDHRIKFPTMTLWSTHLIHRLDDTCHFKVTAPHGNTDFPFTLKTRTSWSKNVTTMTQCPDQIIFGSFEWRTCTILWLAIYLEAWLRKYPDALFLFTNSRHSTKGPENIKRQYKNRMERLVWKDKEFKSLLDATGDDAKKGLGTTSTRKFATTKASRRGATDQQIEYRGRWVGEKGGKVIRRHYITKDDPYTDAYVASLLCDGGPIQYDTKPGTVVTDNWLYIECVPHVRARFEDDDRFCRLLGLAILWAAFDPEVSEFLDPNVSDRIPTNFVTVHGAVDGNPVRKVALQVISSNDRLDIVDMPERRGDNGGGGGGGGAAAAAGPGAVQLPFNPAIPGRVSMDELYGLVQRMEQAFSTQLQGIRHEQGQFRQWAQQEFKKLSQVQRHYAATIPSGFARGNRVEVARRNQHDVAADIQQQQQPQQGAQQQQGQQVVPNGAVLDAALLQQQQTTARRTRLIDPNAILADNLRSLSDYWEEYQHGIGGNKPAKDFRGDEINRNAAFKNKYSRRNKIWKVQEYLITMRGMDLAGACALMADVYGTDKPTPICIGITRDQKHPTYRFANGLKLPPRLTGNR
jgi:Transcriptional activator of glycolytic enzymes